MKKELEERLVKRFSFYRPHLPITHSLMAFGFEHGGGWFDIIWELSLKIEEELKKIEAETNEREKLKKELRSSEDGFNVTQVKEKFGTLRFYTSWATDGIMEAIDEAENKSAHTCEICGKEAVLCARGGWWATRCPEHANSDEYSPAVEKSKVSPELWSRYEHHYHNDD